MRRHMVNNREVVAKLEKIRLREELLRKRRREAATAELHKQANQARREAEHRAAVERMKAESNRQLQSKQEPLLQRKAKYRKQQAALPQQEIRIRAFISSESRESFLTSMLSSIPEKLRGHKRFILGTDGAGLEAVVVAHAALLVPAVTARQAKKYPQRYVIEFI